MWLSLIIYSLSVLLPGWLILTLWFDEVSRGFFKKIALAYGLGTMLLTMEIFVIVFFSQMAKSMVVVNLGLGSGGWFMAVF